MNTPKGKYVWSAKVGEKGQIVIPKQARDVFGISPGDTVILLGDEARGGIAIMSNSVLLDFANSIIEITENGDENNECD